MNYRHAFHAGNFADLVKHAAICLILDRLQTRADPLLVVDTHAGAGLYDLSGSMARKSGEAEAGIRKLMAAPAAPSGFDSLKRAVRDLNADKNAAGDIVFYPGSPLLIAHRLRLQDAYVGAELHEDDFSALTAALAPFAARARAVQADGYETALQWAKQDRRRLFVLVDPPFERGDDYERSADLAKALLARDEATTVAIWTPLKDMETFDAFIRRLETLAAPLLVAEARLKSLDNPMRMNGCGLIFLGEPPGLWDALQPALQWVVDAGGDAGGQAKVWRTGP